jgi:urease subunit beta|tara:strand:- start:3656 stop:3967 length:312 start_codon:yes stop_codon:yes gene_type:complete
MNPGEYILKKKDLELNKDNRSFDIEVSNTGNRPIQVGSHFHFYETNSFLKFDREKTKGTRLNIPSGTAIRFETGQKRTVNLINFMGKRKVFGFNQKIMGKLDK